MTPIGSDEVWQLAIARWAEIARNFPDLEPALALQQRILGILLDASADLQRERAVRYPTSSDAVRDKWVRGVPAFRNEPVAVPPRLTHIFAALCDVLVDGGAGDAPEHLRAALAKGAIDPGSLVRASLARNEKAIRTSALHMGLSPDLVWLVGELGSSPLANQLQASLLERGDIVDHLRLWDRGYCPCCGSWPALIEAVAGMRLLRCSYCTSAWELSTARCVYCANMGSEFMTAAPDPSNEKRRVELCRACGNYTKVVAAAAMTPFPLLAIEDLATIDLDRGAMAREYSRPKMVDLDAIEPLSSVDGCA